MLFVIYDDQDILFITEG